MRNSEVNKESSSYKNKLTLKHAIWATSYVFIAYILYSFLLVLIIPPKTPFSFIEKTQISLSPLFYLIGLSVLLFYVGTRSNLDISCLGFRKLRLKKALQYGIIAGLLLGIMKVLVSQNVRNPNMNFALTTPFRNLIALLFYPHLLFGIWGTITVGPIFEEAFFRGLWYSVLKEKMPKFIATIIASLAFAALHRVSIPFNYFVFFLIGLILTIIYDKTNNLYSSITTHIIINFITFLFLKIH